MKSEMGKLLAVPKSKLCKLDISHRLVSHEAHFCSKDFFNVKLLILTRAAFVWSNTVKTVQLQNIIPI